MASEIFFRAAALILRLGCTGGDDCCRGSCRDDMCLRDGMVGVRPFLRASSSSSILAFSASSPLIASSTSLVFCIPKVPPLQECNAGWLLPGMVAVAEQSSRARLLGLVFVAEGRGAEAAQGELMRFLRK